MLNIHAESSLQVSSLTVCIVVNGKKFQLCGDLDLGHVVVFELDPGHGQCQIHLRYSHIPLYSFLNIRDPKSKHCRVKPLIIGC